MICIFCGQFISDKPIPVISLQFRPFIGRGQPPGQDDFTGMESCQSCYAKILANRAKSIADHAIVEGTKNAY